mgnify:CR=1 FL=1
MKKYTNPFEFIHTPYENKLYISKLKPLSRAYYKMIELMDIFHILEKYKYIPYIISMENCKFRTDTGRKTK